MWSFLRGNKGGVGLRREELRGSWEKWREKKLWSELLYEKRSIFDKNFKIKKKVKVFLK